MEVGIVCGDAAVVGRVFHPGLLDQEVTVTAVDEVWVALDLATVPKPVSHPRRWLGLGRVTPKLSLATNSDLLGVRRLLEFSPHI